MSSTKCNAASVRRVVLLHYRTHGRGHLPWRKTHTPYRIMVSEIMLQQTQVDRVIPFYKNFLASFPTVKDLAAAPEVEVLRAWSGLGYNRRARFLHRAAQAVVAHHGGRMPHTYDTLRMLPGIGEYTAKAIRVFAYNEPEVLIETNVRTVILYHCFGNETQVSEARIRAVAEELARGQDPATWHAALMDYGTHLKKTVGNLSRRSRVYTKQKPFKGSVREVRGAILRARLNGTSLAQVRKAYPDRYQEARAGLKADGLL